MMARASGPASLGLVLVATYYATTLALWAGHWFSHLPWSPFRTFHLRGHHTLYPDSRHTRSARFRYGSGRASSIPALLPWLVIEATLASVLVAGWRLPITLGEIVILVVLLNAVHTQFHLLAPWLEERRWFRTARRRHDFHHDADVNFMVGDHFWDRVFGTFHGVGRC
ncbi:MAG: hypothetical protein DMD93_15065 [Candidatus Rokuibacteriota bacterium]|nr:MAG: hypothetical protein DMD93_15065 [Candidatus Rokubacteria bacterium]